jgi:hypothetical protein
MKRSLALAGATFLLCAAAALGQSQITVFLYDRASLPAETLQAAQTEAEWLLGQAGVTLLWRDCAGTVRCFERLSDSDMVLTILSKRPKNASRGALGHSVSGTGGRATYAWVFHDRVKEQSWESSIAQPVLLGCAMAHELGHLFLGANHANSGLMKGLWGRDEMSRISQRLLRFTEHEQTALSSAAFERVAAARGDTLSAAVRLPFAASLQD